LSTDHTNNTASEKTAPPGQHHDLALTGLDLRQKPIDQWIIGESGPIRRVKKLVAEAASSKSTVLICGETGAGKEPVANAIHYRSDRSQRPFVKMNCAAGPENLIEDELFGHVKGAFTGALAAREGRFECADGGTIFLDEIGEMSLTLQAKLLRVLQQREFERLGSSRVIKVDIRIIAATNRNLKKAIQEGGFRADLYYRLAVIEIALPPLRERRSDIPLLVPHILEKKQTEAGWKRPVLFTPKGFKTLCEIAYDWPGNVRELENKVERLGTSAAAADGWITDAAVLNLFADASFPIDENWVNWPACDSATQYLQEQERAFYRTILAKTGGNKTEAARLLGIKRSTLMSRLKKLGMNHS